jgi:hypothetical protein
MDVDRIPHMGGALRNEAPAWQKPANRRRKFEDDNPESEAEAAEREEVAAAESDAAEGRGTALDVVA